MDNLMDGWMGGIDGWTGGQRTGQWMVGLADGWMDG